MDEKLTRGKNNIELPAAPEKEKGVSVLEGMKSVPEELLWRANFNSDNSIRTYDKAIQNFLGFLGVTTPEQLREVTHGHVIAFKKHLQEKGHSPRTINNRLSAISSLFKHLIHKQVVKINVAEGVKRMQVNENRVEAKVMTPEQVRKMLKTPDINTFQGARDRAILSTLFFTGCRVSEVSKLKVKDFYEEQGFWVMDFWVKGGKRNRLAVNQELQIDIKRYLDLAGHGHDKESYLFLAVKHSGKNTDPDRPLSRKTIDYLFNRYAKRVGVEGVTPHSARATFITQALENNCPIDAVQKSVGHSQIKTTQMYDKRTVKYRESASFAVRY